ncbi:MAG: PASTA domain-containing protein [Chitinophagaceae bacterium]
MIKSLTSRPLWVNILAGIVLTFVIILLFFLSLQWLTHHGVSRTVPSVTGKKFDDAKTFLEKQGFDVIIQDSVYVDTLPPTGVIRQVPEPDAVVKVNRTVYLTINRSMAPLVDMPSLVGYSLRNAEMVLKNMGLRIGDTIFKPDFAKNSVLEQRYNGDEIKPGTKIRQGSSVTLVLGNGVGQDQFAVPNLIGKTFGESRALLESNGLSFLSVILNNDVTDTVNAYIYRQLPARYNADGKIQHIRAGQTIDVWLSLQKPAGDSTAAAEPPVSQ